MGTAGRPGWLAKFTLVTHISQRDRLMACWSLKWEVKEKKGNSTDVPSAQKLGVSSPWSMP